MEVAVPFWSSLVRTVQYTLEVNEKTTEWKWQKMGKESTQTTSSTHPTDIDGCLLSADIYAGHVGYSREWNMAPILLK